MLTDVYISGTSMTKFGKRKENFYELVIESAKEVLQNSKLEAEDISHIVIGTQDLPDFVGKEELDSGFFDFFGKTKLYSMEFVDAMSASGAGALHKGCKILEENFDKKEDYNVLVIGAQKMTHLQRKDLTSVIAKVIDPRIRKGDSATMLKIAAKVMESYKKQGLEYTDLNQMAAELHVRAALNQYARFYGKYGAPKEIKDIVNSQKNKITVENTEFRMFHSTSTDDGAAAVVLSNKPRELDKYRRRSVKIIGHGVGDASPILEERDAGKYFFEATYEAAQQAFSMSGIQPKDLFGNVLVEAHDAFLNYVYPQLVGAGFYDSLEDSIKAFRNGEFTISGNLPTNVSGGLKGRGHPLGASSLAQVVEIVNQMRGQAGDLQLNRVFDYGVSTAIGGPAVKNYVTILQRC